MPWRGIAVAATTVVAGLTLLGRVVDFTVDWAWFSALGYRDVFWTLFSTKAALFLTSFAATAMIIWWNGWLATRLTERGTGRSLELSGITVRPQLSPAVPDVVHRRRFPGVAARLHRIVSMIGNIGLVIGVVALLALHGQALLGTFGTGAVAASIILVAGALLIGWLIAGADTAARPVLTLGTGARNVPAALVVANLNFDDPDVLVMCVLFAVVSLVGLLVTARQLGRRAPAAAAADTPSGS